MQLFAGVFKGKKVLITGDTGFKGSWLAIWLHELGAEVHGYSLAPKTMNDNFVACKLKNIISHKDGDVRSLKDLSAYFKKIQPDIAFHLAAQALVLESYKSPHETFETNLMGVVNFLEAVRQTPSVKVAINITSDKCYQNNEQSQGYREEDHMGGNDPYSASKGCSELISHAYQKSFFNTLANCLVATARAGNVIGGGDWAEDRIVPDFYKAILQNKPLLIRNPTSIRPWQHVLEPLSGYLWLCAKLFFQDPDFIGPWNFGPNEKNSYSVEDLIKKLIHYSGNGSYTIDTFSSKPLETKMLKLDITKSMSKLQWHPVLDFEDTIQFTAQGYADQMRENDVYLMRKEQIGQYIEKAKESHLQWTQEKNI